MNSVPYDVAVELLSRPLICPDIEDWRPQRLQSNMSLAEGGVMAADGSRSGLRVQLMFARSAKTKLAEFKLTVFQVNLSALQRVYQLHVNGVAHAPKNWHDHAHEHIGMRRVDGDSKWLMWAFPEAVEYFSWRTNITFAPPILDPEDFRLK